LHCVHIQLLYFLIKFGILPILAELLVNKKALCDIFLCHLKMFSEGDSCGFEDHEYLNNPPDQGKPGHPYYEASHSIA
jgi:hypothetical protein